MPPQVPSPKPPTWLRQSSGTLVILRVATQLEPTAKASTTPLPQIQVCVSPAAVDIEYVFKRRWNPSVCVCVCVCVCVQCACTVVCPLPCVMVLAAPSLVCDRDGWTLRHSYPPESPYRFRLVSWSFRSFRSFLVWVQALA